MHGLKLKIGRGSRCFLGRSLHSRRQMNGQKRSTMLTIVFAIWVVPSIHPSDLPLLCSSRPEEGLTRPNKIMLLRLTATLFGIPSTDGFN